MGNVAKKKSAPTVKKKKNKSNPAGNDKSTRASASQFFVAGELCRRGYLAVVTMGNTPNTDILCSNLEGTKCVHIQVKTFVPGKKTCSVGRKAEKPYGDNFFWVLGGIPPHGSSAEFQYFIIPAAEMSKNVINDHQEWLATPGKKKQAHKDNDVRTVKLPPYSERFKGWKVGEFQGRWDIIEEKLKA